ncbi:MAG: hypothetical protein QM752_04995 [Gammaproteobacteria bacterium]
MVLSLLLVIPSEAEVLSELIMSGALVLGVLVSMEGKGVLVPELSDTEVGAEVSSETLGADIEPSSEALVPISLGVVASEGMLEVSDGMAELSKDESEGVPSTDAEV